MKYLLDTAIFLWSLDAQEKMNDRTRQVLENRDEELFLSPVVSWEIVIKAACGKLTLSRPAGEMLSLAFTKFEIRSLPITHAHSLALSELPLVHNDPFDRMLVAQARCERMTFMTVDSMCAKYPVDILWCG